MSFRDRVSSRRISPFLVEHYDTAIPRREKSRLKEISLDAAEQFAEKVKIVASGVKTPEESTLLTAGLKPRPSTTKAFFRKLRSRAFGSAFLSRMVGAGVNYGKICVFLLPEVARVWSPPAAFGSNFVNLARIIDGPIVNA